MREGKKEKRQTEKGKPPWNGQRTAWTKETMVKEETCLKGHIHLQEYALADLGSRKFTSNQREKRGGAGGHAAEGVAGSSLKKGSAVSETVNSSWEGKGIEI